MKAIQRHLYWQLVAFVCILGGFYAIYRNKACHYMCSSASICGVCILRLTEHSA